MPEFTSNTQRQLPSGQGGDVLVDPQSFSQNFQESKRLGEAIQRSAVALSEFDKQHQLARDNDAIQSAESQYDLFLETYLNDIDNRNDFEVFENEFDDGVLRLKGNVLKNESLSSFARDQIESRFDTLTDLSRIKVQQRSRRKEMDLFRAKYQTHREQLVRNGDLDGVIDLTNSKFNDNVITGAEREKAIRDDTRAVKYNEAAAIISVNPEDASNVINSPVYETL
jgi:hypothetical protein